MTVYDPGVKGCVWSVCRSRGYDPVLLKSLQFYQVLLNFWVQDLPHCQTQCALPPGRDKTSLQFLADGSESRSNVLLLSSHDMKAAVRVGGFTLPMVTVSECVLGLLVSFSTMQGCSEPVALQMHQQGSFFIFSGRKLKNLAPFGARGFFCSLAPKYHCVYLCFHDCLELHFSCYSKILGAGWGESEELYSRCSHLIWFSLGQKISKGMKAAPATYHLCLPWVRKESGLLGVCHGLCPPAVTFLWSQNGQLCRGLTHGCSLGNLEQKVSQLWVAKWLEEALTA